MRLGRFGFGGNGLNPGAMNATQYCGQPGAREHGGVLTPTLKVHGTTGLRVVDASVFPRIPGLFIASAVYMVGEKAADMIANGDS